MALVMLLIILAFLLGGAGLAVESLRWLLIVALALVVVSFLTHRRGGDPLV